MTAGATIAEKLNRTFKQFLLLFIIFLLFLPVIQVNVLKMKMTPLVGVQDTVTKPAFTTRGFLDGSWQERRMNYAAEKAGFRPWLIRLKNQLDYSLFNYTGSGGVVIGREGCLFLKSYINNYCGIEFQGTRRIDYEVQRLTAVSRELKKKNVSFLLVLAPGKATFEQEKIPARYRKRPITNYEYYSRKLASSGIDVIDLNRWFRELKGKTPYPLFPKNGVHWTSYGVALAADTITHCIEKLRSIDMPEIDFSRIRISDTMRYSDNDAGDLMNVFRLKGNTPMPYPEFSYIREGKHRPDIVAIADSYWWGFITSGISRNIFGKARYWFYNKDIYDDEQKLGTVAGTDVCAELEKQEAVIVLVTEATWMLFPFGFTDAFLQGLQPETGADREMQISIVMDRIRREPNWYHAIMEKAEKNHVPAEEQLRRDAEYLIGLENNKKNP